MSKLFEYALAVPVYDYYRKYWQPKESQSLDFVHEKDNLFDFFTVKVMDQDAGAIVSHLAVETSRATKFPFGMGATVVLILTSTNYCV